jgi:hypothetical protein
MSIISAALFVQVYTTIMAIWAEEGCGSPRKMHSASLGALFVSIWKERNRKLPEKVQVYIHGKSVTIVCRYYICNLARNDFIIFLKKSLFIFSTPAVDVMITICCDFRQFSSKKLAFFSKTNAVIKMLHILALFWLKNANFFRRFFRRNYF